MRAGRRMPRVSTWAAWARQGPPDAIAGLLLGTSCALLAALAVDQAQRRLRGRQAGAASRQAVPSADRL